MTIKEILNTIKPSEKDALMVAFENQIPYFIEFKPGAWVGVNTDAIPNLIVQQTAGLWRSGTFRNEFH